MKGLFEVHSVEETWQLARDFAAQVKPGDVICLEGDLGAGKTTWTQGFAAALGMRGCVTSPTFCIVSEHRVKETPKDGAPSLLVHMDLYRLHDEGDVEAIGWEDYRREGAVLVIEWPDRAGSLIPPDAYHIIFHHSATSEESRLIEFK